MIDEAYKELAVAILKQAYDDVKLHPKEIENFVKSEWCQDLCDFINLPYVSYKTRVLKIVSQVMSHRRKLAHWGRV